MYCYNTITYCCYTNRFAVFDNLFVCYTRLIHHPLTALYHPHRPVLPSICYPIVFRVSPCYFPFSSALLNRMGAIDHVLVSMSSRDLCTYCSIASFKVLRVKCSSQLKRVASGINQNISVHMLFKNQRIVSKLLNKIPKSLSQSVPLYETCPYQKLIWVS